MSGATRVRGSVHNKIRERMHVPISIGRQRQRPSLPWLSSCHSGPPPWIRFASGRNGWMFPTQNQHHQVNPDEDLVLGGCQLLLHVNRVASFHQCFQGLHKHHRLLNTPQKHCSASTATIGRPLAPSPHQAQAAVIPLQSCNGAHSVYWGTVGGSYRNISRTALPMVWIESAHGRPNFLLTEYFFFSIPRETDCLGSTTRQHLPQQTIQ